MLASSVIQLAAPTSSERFVRLIAEKRYTYPRQARPADGQNSCDEREHCGNDVSTRQKGSNHRWRHDASEYGGQAGSGCDEAKNTEGVAAEAQGDETHRTTGAGPGPTHPHLGELFIELGIIRGPVGGGGPREWIVVGHGFPPVSVVVLGTNNIGGMLPAMGCGGWACRR